VAGSKENKRGVALLPLIQYFSPAHSFIAETQMVRLATMELALLLIALFLHAVAGNNLCQNKLCPPRTLLL